MVDVKRTITVVCRTRLWFIFVFLLATKRRKTLASFSGLPLKPGIPECKPCAIDSCVNATNCRGGITMDVCNCCTKCLSVQGEPCGGIYYRLGRCDKNLFCNITGPYRRDPIGRCAAVSSRSDTPSETVPLHDTEVLKQPGVPAADDEILDGVITSVDRSGHNKHTNAKKLDEDINDEHKTAFQPMFAPAIAFVACGAGLALILGLTATCLTRMERKR